MTRAALLISTAFILFSSVHSIAQILPRDDEKAGLEDLYDEYEAVEEKQNKNKQEQMDKRQAERDRVAEKEINRISDLSELAPFEDIAVIQLRFLPKTSRFELSASAITTTNNQYFSNVGLDLRAAYFFNEKYGLEGIYKYITSTERPITEGLVDNQGIKTDSLVQPESFYGAVFKWTPVYGKIAWFQQKIIPFDLYFTPGIGMTQTDAGGSSTTISMGIGQLFAITKSLGVRWDFNWNYYSADIKVTTLGQPTTNETKNHSDLFLGIGLSYFIPEATYR